MALLHSSMVPLGTAAIDFKLPGVDGKEYSLKSFAVYKVIVIIFMCNHCPYVKAVIQRLIDLQQEVLAQGVRLIGINCNDAINYPDDSFESMHSVSKGWKMNFPYLFDESQEIAKKYDAVCTPDFFGYNKDLKLNYRGRIRELNDLKPVGAGDSELLKSMKLIAETQQGPKEQHPSMGCSIKWFK